MGTKDVRVNIIGAGLAGLAAAIRLSQLGVQSRLVSVQPSERAQSNLAEGGINACLDLMGEEDTVEEHIKDTLRGGCFLADEAMVEGLCKEAPEIIRELSGYGVAFARENGRLIQRNFGGQKKKRTAFVKSSTGKVIMASMIKEVRKHERNGMVQRLFHHEYTGLITDKTRDEKARDPGSYMVKCRGVYIRDTYDSSLSALYGPVIIATGGMNGVFEAMTTGTYANTGEVSADLFMRGVRLANLEFIQYHPTTVSISGKRMLISEAARGEGGRLFYYGDNEEKIYFLEDEFGEGGNLMPRDVISKRMDMCGKQVYLDLTQIDGDKWNKRLSDLRREIMYYLSTDPVKEPVPVSPGIHFFMGGIKVGRDHMTNIRGLYAAGECSCAYHGANRLGGNSLLGAIYGGKVAAASAAAIYKDEYIGADDTRKDADDFSDERMKAYLKEPGDKDMELRVRMRKLLASALSVVRKEAEIEAAIRQTDSLLKEAEDLGACIRTLSLLMLSKAMLVSAYGRKESRGAHNLAEYPKQAEEYGKNSTVAIEDGRIRLSYEYPGEYCE